MQTNQKTFLALCKDNSTLKRISPLLSPNNQIPCSDLLDMICGHVLVHIEQTTLAYRAHLGDDISQPPCIYILVMKNQHTENSILVISLPYAPQKDFQQIPRTSLHNTTATTLKAGDRSHWYTRKLIGCGALCKKHWRKVVGVSTATAAALAAYWFAGCNISSVTEWLGQYTTSTLETLGSTSDATSLGT